MAIADRREIVFDRDAFLHWNGHPRVHGFFCLPPLIPDGERYKPADGLGEATYRKLTAARVFLLPVEALGAIMIA